MCVRPVCISTHQRCGCGTRYQESRNNWSRRFSTRMRCWRWTPGMPMPWLTPPALSGCVTRDTSRRKISTKSLSSIVPSCSASYPTTLVTPTGSTRSASLYGIALSVPSRLGTRITRSCISDKPCSSILTLRCRHSQQSGQHHHGEGKGVEGQLGVG